MSLVDNTVHVPAGLAHGPGGPIGNGDLPIALVAVVLEMPRIGHAEVTGLLGVVLAGHHCPAAAGRARSQLGNSPLRQAG